jgi:hypothetical protein
MTDPADIVRAATIGRRAPIGRIRYAAERISAVLDRGADPAVNLLAVRTILDGVADELDAAPEFPLPIRADGTHYYVSTYCVDGQHAACRLTCKCCSQPCQCATCKHPAVAGPATGREDVPLAREATPEEAARMLANLAQSGVETPGCDCGHDGMGASWHRDGCYWRAAL